MAVPMVPRERLTIRGKQYEPTMDDVLSALFRVPAPEVPPGGYYVTIRRKRYPLRFVVGRTLGLRSSDFGHAHATAFCRYLGLPFGRLPED